MRLGLLNASARCPGALLTPAEQSDDPSELGPAASRATVRCRAPTTGAGRGVRRRPASAAAAQPATLPVAGHPGPGQTLAPALEPEHEPATDRVRLGEAHGHRVAERKFLA